MGELTVAALMREVIIACSVRDLIWGDWCGLTLAHSPDLTDTAASLVSGHAGVGIITTRPEPWWPEGTWRVYPPDPPTEVTHG